MLMQTEAVDRTEGWVWWLLLVGALIIVFLFLMILRRHLLRPMPHTPTDTTDAWTEAGRRLKVPPAGEDEDPSAEDRS
jgi:hypothetical protein